MADLKISIITISYNAKDTISRCIRSVIDQRYNNLEYIIIDGGSTDGTLKVINRYKTHISLLLSEPDGGIYDAMNKGLLHATGDVIGMLNADDVFAAPDTLYSIAKAFNTNPDIVYGDLDYINPDGQIFRKWRSGAYVKGMFNKGWMPPHPTFYCKKALFEKLGNYSIDYGTAADYELMLRFMHLNDAAIYYLPVVLVKMSTGGVSNKSYINRIKALYNDYRAMRRNNISYPVITLMLKPISKIKQFF